MAACALMFVSMMALPAEAAVASSLSDQFVILDGPTDEFGGGEQFLVRFGPEATFGVIWGTEDEPNSIYIVTVMPRHLGYVDIQNGQGNMVAEGQLAKVTTMYVVRMDSLTEFSDADGDGLMSFGEVAGPGAGRYGNIVMPSIGADPIYKTVNLTAAWEATVPVYSEIDGERSWSFSLTARNLTYQAVQAGTDTTVGDGVLNNLTLDLRLDASAVHVSNAQMAQYRVRTAGEGQLGELERVRERTVAGNVTSFDVKWNKTVDGWDYDPENAAPALLVEFSSFVGNDMSGDQVQNRYMDQEQFRRMVAEMNESGFMTANAGTNSSGDRYDGRTGAVEEGERALTASRLSFGGENSRIGSFEWVQTCRYGDDGNAGEDGQVRAQLMGVWDVTGVQWGEWQFDGFLARTGMVFPGGAYIFQDPAVSSEALTDVSAVEPSPIPTDGFPLGLAAVGLIAAAALGGAMVMSRRNRSGKVDYDHDEDAEKEDWSKYYDKK